MTFVRIRNQNFIPVNYYCFYDYKVTTTSTHQIHAVSVTWNLIKIALAYPGKCRRTSTLRVAILLVIQWEFLSTFKWQPLTDFPKIILKEILEKHSRLRHNREKRLEKNKIIESASPMKNGFIKREYVNRKRKWQRNTPSNMVTIRAS